MKTLIIAFAIIMLFLSSCYEYENPLDLQYMDDNMIVRTPSFSLSGGTYTTVQTVIISCATSGASIRYTTNGSDPSELSTLYSSPIAVSSTTTLKAKAFKTNYKPSSTATAAYTMNFPSVATPSFSPAGGTYTSVQSVSISCATSGASISYTTNGTDPSESSALYSSAVSISGTTTLKAKAFKTNFNPSSSATAVYTINLPTVATPSFSPAGGTYTSVQTVSISSATSGASIRYTTNGGDPSEFSTLYSSPISVSSTTTLKAKAYKSNFNPSSTETGTYTINLPTVATPSFSPTGGTYTSVQTVSIFCATSGANIRYTTNGSDPTTSSTLYSTSLSISSTTTLIAKAFKTNYNPSSTATAAYTINIPTVATPSFSPAGGTYTSLISVAIYCNTSGATIRYTTDGNDPISSSTVYSNLISVSSTTTIKAKAFKAGWTDSDIASALYTLALNFEGFESGNFSAFPWSNTVSGGGNQPWYITGWENMVYDGSYSAMGGSVLNPGSSNLQITRNCSGGDITFYRKHSNPVSGVSLNFYIDNVLQGSWSDETPWGMVSYQVNSGNRTFKWSVIRTSPNGPLPPDDYIDNITFP